ncbi:MAG: hypothetical protein Q9163_003087 [Psora crenata]
MPLKDPRYEYVRLRSRREKDRDHEKDSRNPGGSSAITVRDKKRRNSITSNPAASSEAAPQPVATPYQDVALEQLPPLPETEESESASAATSPIARTDSNIFNPNARSSPPQTEPSARLQPYLESVCDTASTITSLDQDPDTKEWIGPNPDTPSSSSLLLDLPTPTPKFGDFSGLAGSVATYQVADQLSEGTASGDADLVESTQAKRSGDADPVVYSQLGHDRHHEDYYHPSQMVNPFLPISPAPLPGQTVTTSEPSRTSPQTPTSVAPKAPTPPLPARQSPPARLEPPRPPSHGPPMTSSIASRYDYPMVPAISPIPMVQTYSNPLPYPSGPPMIDHPANLLHRIASVLPDINALMDLYQNTCHILMTRDHHIAHLQAQKAADAQQQNARVERLTGEIESVLKKNAAQVQKLKGIINELEEKHSQLNESYLKERRLKEEARAVYASSRAQHAEAEKQHHEDILQMQQDFADEKANMLAEHSTREKELIGQMHAEARNAEENLMSRIAEMTRNHEIDRQDCEELWLRAKQIIETGHIKVCQDLENTISMKEKLLEEERRNHSRARDGWDRERVSMTSQWDEERYQLRKSAEDQRQILASKHQKEKDDMLRSMEVTLSRQKPEAHDTIVRLQQEKDELRQQLEATHAHYKSEIQGAANNLRKEKDEYARSMEAAFSRQTVELQDTIRQLHQEKEDLRRSRLPSQSRQITEAGETISKLQKEMETLRAGWNSDKAKWPKHTTESMSSRSSTPAPKEDRNKLKRASGVYGSGTSLKSKGATFEQSSRGDDGHRGQSRDRTN